MNDPKKRSAGPLLMWSGLTMILLPVAVVCLAIVAALVVAYPPAAIVFVVLVGGLVRARWDRWRESR